MPVFGVQQALARRQAIVDATQALMREGIDFGTIPGTPKPTLLKPGAEKLCTLFGLCPTFFLEASEEDWDGTHHNGEPFFYYRYKCVLERNGYQIGQGVASCNTWESKYRYRWVSEADIPPGIPKNTLRSRDGAIAEFAFAVEKAETSGRYGKPAEYWQRFKDAIAAGEARRVQRETKAGKTMDAWEIGAAVYRVPNPDVYDQVNTAQKMAQKRALIAATLIAINASEFYTQDLEDLATEGIDTGSHPVGTKEAAAAVGERKIEEMRNAAKSEPPEPNPEDAEKISDSVIAMWKRMKDKASCIAELAVLKDRLQTLGREKEYYRVLEAAGKRHANEFTKIEDARKAAESMLKVIQVAETLLMRESGNGTEVA